MATFRIMTYNVRSCRGNDGRVDPGRVIDVISDGAPDIVALQEIDSSADSGHLRLLAGRLGMRAYADPAWPENAFLSYYPISGLRAHDLGGGRCLRGDVDLGGKRLHLFNLRLSSAPELRRQQITRLLGPELLASNSLGCPCMVLGDFGDFWWGAGNFDLNMMLRQVRRPLWRATYPARLPLAGRDRAYLMGAVRVLEATVQCHPPARFASSHLPLVLTVQIVDPRHYLRLEKLKPGRMETAPG